MYSKSYREHQYTFLINASIPWQTYRIK